VHTVDAESIGILVFRDAGVGAYRDALDRAMRQPESLRRWYLSVVNEMAQKMAVQTVSIEGCWWTEIDSPRDLASARGHYPQRTQPQDSTR
jgi:choline kinase